MLSLPAPINSKHMGRSVLLHATETASHVTVASGSTLCFDFSRLGGGFLVHVHSYTLFLLHKSHTYSQETSPIFAVCHSPVYSAVAFCNYSTRIGGLKLPFGYPVVAVKENLAVMTLNVDGHKQQL